MKIKKYANRKLYSNDLSRYVTIDQVKTFVRNGHNVTVVDNVSKEDITKTVLAKCISSLSIDELYDLIRR